MLILLNELNSYGDTRLVTPLDSGDNRIQYWINPGYVAFSTLIWCNALIDQSADLLSIGSVTLHHGIGRPPPSAVIIANFHLLNTSMRVSVVYIDRPCYYSLDGGRRMLTITPLTEVVLTHRAYHVGVAESGHAAALSRKGAGSLISPGGNSVTPFKLAFDPQHVSLSVNGGLLAVTGGNGISIISTSTLKPIHRLNDSFESSGFGPTGLLWTCARLYSETVTLEIWDPQTWTKVARTKITDPYGDAHFHLLSHPNDNCMVIWVAAGQDGQSLFWARHDDHTIVVDRFPELDYTTWPSFSPTGKEFLVISGGELHRYKYPRGPMDARMQWPSEDEEDQMGDFVSYVDADYALLQSLNERLYLVDLETMTIEDEIRLHGHEPRPVSELYPNIRGDRRLSSDLSFFLRFPNDQFLSVHSEFSSAHPDDRLDHILTWRIPDPE
jgi:hypothetical protein